MVWSAVYSEARLIYLVLRRFETQFFVTFLPQTSASTSSSFSFGEKQERLPTPDGGQEVISAKFVHPSEAISLHRQGKMAFMPPQFYILSTLSDILKGTQNDGEQRARVMELSQGSFGRMVINPVGKGQDEQGRTILTYEGDELRGGSKGRLHRAHLKMGKGVSRFPRLRLPNANNIRVSSLQERSR
jgi:hypothetical protein